ncbi:hypothetical protein MJ863_06190 [Alcaligenes ammonioxydans]|uniref:hypothetical protein n=1 Tax=Alcaligenes TaxID=507 RepID=UPI001F065E18|nr:hypothetical protein [Alcaligenes ammonioxydans]MCH1879175.1 hypothetical protein [Alcaligenes ammonioxydans]
MGHARGIAAGIQADFNEGWSATVVQCNPMLEELGRGIARLTGEIHTDNDYIRGLRAALEKVQPVSGLYHRDRDKLVELHKQEKAQRERLESLIAVARPA